MIVWQKRNRFKITSNQSLCCFKVIITKPIIYFYRFFIFRITDQDTIIYTANSANDFVNFIENFNGNSNDLAKDYLENNDINVHGLDDEVENFDLTNNGLDFFKDDQVFEDTMTNEINIEINKDEVNLLKQSYPDTPSDDYKKDIKNTKSNKVIIKKLENVNMVIKKNPNKTITIRRIIEPVFEKQQPDETATTILCSECGLYYKIDDELFFSKNNLETLAARTLFELQKINPDCEKEHLIFVNKGIEICDRVLKSKEDKSFTIINLLSNDQELIAFTGIDFALLEKLTKLVIQYEENCQTFKNLDSPRDRIIMCLCKLKTDLSFGCLANLFGIEIQLLLNYFFTTIRTLAVLLEKMIYWPKSDKDQQLCQNGMPINSQNYNNFPKALLSCHEMQIDKQKCDDCRKSEKNDKHIETLKIILAVSLDGLIIFKSDVYKFNRESDGTSIFTKTNILNYLDLKTESITTDDTLKNEIVEEECHERCVKLIKLPDVNDDTYDLVFVKNFCVAKLNVDRTLQRYKKFKIMRNVVSWRILSCLNDVCNVVAGIVNMNNDIQPDETKL